MHFKFDGVLQKVLLISPLSKNLYNQLIAEKLMKKYDKMCFLTKDSTESSVTTNRRDFLYKIILIEAYFKLGKKTKNILVKI